MVALKGSSSAIEWLTLGLESLTAPATTSVQPDLDAPPGVHMPVRFPLAADLTELAAQNARLAAANSQLRCRYLEAANAELRRHCLVTERKSGKSSIGVALKADAAEFVPGSMSFAADDTKPSQWNLISSWDACIADASTTAGSPVATQLSSNDNCSVIELSSDVNCSVIEEEECNQAAWTGVTMMLRNVPKCFTTRLLVEVLDSAGFRGHFDFCYVPVKFESGISNGFGFVNLSSDDAVERFTAHFAGLTSWGVDGEDGLPCEVEPTVFARGLQANIDHYRNSSVLHESVQKDFKPVLFSDGVEIAFPSPTKMLKAPKPRGVIRS